MATINVQVTEAMHDAIFRFAKLQSAKFGFRVTISDIVVQAIRNAGFEREDVLESIAKGECPDIDVRRRTPATKRTESERVREYMEGRGCQTEVSLQRNLHMKAAEVRRAVFLLLEAGVIRQRPFDRPVILHWGKSCGCAIAVDPELPKETQ